MTGLAVAAKGMRRSVMDSGEGRAPRITPALEPELYGHIRGKCGEVKAFVHALDGTEDHTHLVCSLPPTLCVADFLHRIFGEPNQVRIPLFGGGGAVRHAVAELHQRVLNMARLLVVVQIFGQLRIGEVASKPGIPPE